MNNAPEISLTQLRDEVSYELKHNCNDNINANDRLVILMYGPPGSGKTTNASLLVNALNEQHPLTSSSKSTSDSELISQTLNRHGIIPTQKISGLGGEETQICIYKDNIPDKVKHELSPAPYAVHLKMDGFHLPLSILPEDMVKFRGCHDSFDAELVVRLSKLLLECDSTNNDWDLLSIPDFSHEIKDPTNPGTFIWKDTKVVVLEGLYLMLDVTPWEEIPRLVESIKKVNSNKRIESRDTHVHVRVVRIYGGDECEMSARVAARHLHSGLVGSYQEGLDKYLANDKINAHVVETKSIRNQDDWVVNTSSVNGQR